MLKLENVYKDLEKFKVKNINLTIKDGEYLTILGPTGAGKSIMLEIIAGLYKVDCGNIYFDNYDITNFYPEDRQIGFVYQDYLLFPYLSVRENIIFGLKQKKISKEQINIKLEHIVSLFNIEHLLERDPKTLSGGEQQRVAIARALIINPKIILMDEPLSALDPLTKKEFMKIFKKIHSKNKNSIVIHVTHDFNVASCLSDKIAIMNNGEIVQMGTPYEIFNKPNCDFVTKFTNSEIYK